MKPSSMKSRWAYSCESRSICYWHCRVSLKTTTRPASDSSQYSRMETEPDDHSSVRAFGCPNLHLDNDGPKIGATERYLEIGARLRK